jgi:hypothetical protein
MRTLLIAALPLAMALAGCSSTPESTRPPRPPPVVTGSACLADLRAKSAIFESVTMPAEGACIVSEPVRARSLAIQIAPSTRMSCALADRLLDFDREVVQPAAQRILGLKVVSIRHFGAYACRDEKSSRHQLSQHAFAKAFDLAGFVMSDGRHIDVAKDWRDDEDRGAFLHEVAKRACAYFSVVLTPDSNKLHHDHFHLDIGPDRLCGPA